MIATFLNQKTSYLTLSQFLIKSFSVPLRYYKFLCLLRATSPDLKCFPLTHLSSYFAPLSSFHTTFLLFFPTPIIFSVSYVSSLHSSTISLWPPSAGNNKLSMSAKSWPSYSWPSLSADSASVDLNNHGSKNTIGGNLLCKVPKPQT